MSQAGTSILGAKRQDVCAGLFVYMCKEDCYENQHRH